MRIFRGFPGGIQSLVGKIPHDVEQLSLCATTTEPCSRAQEPKHWAHLLPLPKPQIRSDQITGSVVSDFLRPHESQHTRLPCPSPTPGVHWDSRLSSQWCHPAISSSVVPFSSCSQSLPASESSNESALRMRWPKYWSFSFSPRACKKSHQNETPTHTTNEQPPLAATKEKSTQQRRPSAVKRR